MRLSSLDVEFWAVGLVLNVTLLVILLYRHRARVYPFFTTLIALMVLKTVVLFLVSRYGTRVDYRHAYWSLTSFDTLLQLLVVYEVASRVFRPLKVWATDLRQNFLLLAAFSVSIALGLALLATPPVRDWMQSCITKGNLFAAALMSELLVAMVALSVMSGYPWRTHAATIARGIGIYSVIAVMIESGHVYFGLEANKAAFIVLSQVRMLAYLGCVVYWIVALARDELPSLSMPAEMRTRLLSLQSRMEVDLRYLRSRNNQ